jgi:hypothetical protein
VYYFRLALPRRYFSHLTQARKSSISIEILSTVEKAHQSISLISGNYSSKNKNLQKNSDIIEIGTLISSPNISCLEVSLLKFYSKPEYPDI